MEFLKVYLKFKLGVSGNLGQGKTNLLDGATQLNEGLKQLKDTSQCDYTRSIGDYAKSSFYIYENIRRHEDSFG